MRTSHSTLRSSARRLILLLGGVLTMTGLALLLASSAFAVELNPEAIENIAVKTAEDVRLPTVVHEAFYPLARPNYGDLESESVLARDEAAASVAGHEITGVAENLSEDPIVQDVVRDCSKDALRDTAWDLWYSWSEHVVFSPREELEGAISSCLEKYVAATPEVADEIAETLSHYILEGAQQVLELENNDLAGLADWLQVADYYYIEQ